MKKIPFNPPDQISKELIEFLKQKNLFIEIHPTLFSSTPDIIVYLKNKKEISTVEKQIIDLQQFKLF